YEGPVFWGPSQNLLAFAALQLRFVGALQDDELDAAVLAPALLVVLRADRLGLAVAVGLEPAGQDVALLERTPHRLGAPLGEVEVVGVVAALVGVPLDLDQIDLRVAVDRRRDRVEQREGDRFDLVLVGLEVDLVQDLQLPLVDDDLPLVGAAVGVLVAVVGLRLVRTLVVLVQDAVVVVVGIGAAVLIFEAVLVLRMIGTEVVLVGDAVLVVVRVGTAVGILEVVLVLGIVGALVDVVGDAVAVAVERRVVGAAVLILVAVLGLGIVRALVVDVGDAVLVVVGIGAAVGVLEVVEVLRVVGALVDVVLVAVAVAVADRRLEDEADEGARRRRPVAVGHLVAAADLEERVARQVQLHAGDRLGREAHVGLGAVGVDPLRVGPVVAVDLADEVELLRDDAVRQSQPADELVADADPGAGDRRGDHRGRRVTRVHERHRVVGEHGAVRADAHAAVDRGPEASQVADLGVEDDAGLEDRLPLAEERLLVPRREDDRRDDRQAQPVAGGVHQADLRMHLQ